MSTDDIAQLASACTRDVLQLYLYQELRNAYTTQVIGAGLQSRDYAEKPNMPTELVDEINAMHSASAQTRKLIACLLVAVLEKAGLPKQVFHPSTEIKRVKGASNHTRKARVCIDTQFKIYKLDERTNAVLPYCAHLAKIQAWKENEVFHFLPTATLKNIDEMKVDNLTQHEWLDATKLAIQQVAQYATL